VPDLTVVLDVEPSLGRERRGEQQDRLESEPDDFHSRVRDRFRTLARRAPSRYLVVDGAADAEDIAGMVRERLVALLPESPVAAQARAERERRQQEQAEQLERDEAVARAEAERAERADAERRDRELAGRAAREAADLEARERAEREAAERTAAERRAQETTTLPVVDGTAVLPVVDEPRSTPLRDEIFGTRREHRR
jgi:dTMP kinase